MIVIFPEIPLIFIDMSIEYVRSFRSPVKFAGQAMASWRGQVDNLPHHSYLIAKTFAAPRCVIPRDIRKSQKLHSGI